MGGERLARLGLLGSAMAGRSLEVVAADRGAPAWTDGLVVHLDPDLAHAESIRALGVQASLLAAGSLAPEVLGRLGRGREAVRRYLAIEGHRALAANEAFLPPAVAAMIDHGVAGSVDSPQASLERALARSPAVDLPPCFGTIRVREVARVDQQAVGMAKPANPGGRTVPSLPELDDEEAGDDDGYLGDLVSSPVGGGGPIGRLLQRLLTPARRRGGGGPPGADSALRVGRAPGARTGTVVATSSTPSAAGEETGPGSRLTYPEWDVHRRRYRPDWCTVVESDAPSAPALPMPDGALFRRSLARLGTGLVGCRRRPQGDDIDIDAAIEAAVEARAGSPVDESLYVESLRRRRDLSVLVLLDVSGSAGEPGHRGRPIHEAQRWTAAALAVAVHDLGDRVALHAFNSHGRTSVRMMRVKGFDDPFDGRVAQRLGGLAPAAYTRMGAAIRHGTTLVDERGGTSRRLLVVLSDGFAYDHGYEGRYGEADARRALSEARRRGVGCLCVSIGAGVEAAALRRVFGTAAHASVSTPEELVTSLGPLFRASLRSAETRRRVSQRRVRTRERLAIEGNAA